jgi:pimeloyl-ACP methyl ester carboxylesterase
MAAGVLSQIGFASAIFASSAMLAPLSAQTTPRPPVPPATARNYWRADNRSDTVLIFVHGVLSSPRGAWLLEGKTDSTASVFFPDLVADDPRFGQPAIFMAGYETDLSTGNYDIEQAVKSVREALVLPDLNGHHVLDRHNIVFVTHSMGGVVVRDLLTRYTDDFKGKNIGLVMYASPSHGSQFATDLDFAAQTLGQSQVRQMRLGSTYLADIHGRFLDLRQRGTLSITGAEACENLAIGGWFTRLVANLLGGDGLVVDPGSCSVYFNSIRVIPRTTHTTISKPNDRQHESFSFLLNYYANVFVPSIRPPPRLDFAATISATADSVESVPYDPSPQAINFAAGCEERHYAVGFRMPAEAKLAAKDAAVSSSNSRVQVSSVKLRGDSILLTLVVGKKETRGVDAGGSALACPDSVSSSLSLHATILAPKPVVLVSREFAALHLSPTKTDTTLSVMISAPSWASGSLHWSFALTATGVRYDGFSLPWNLNLQPSNSAQAGVFADQRSDGSVHVNASQFLLGRP